MTTDFTAARAAGLVSAFDMSGVHRVGTPGDFASGEWLSGEAAGAGAEISHAPVALNRTVVDAAYIECGGQRIDGLPMFDSPPTPGAAVHGNLVANGGAGEVGYVELPPNSASIKGQPFEHMRRTSVHAAMVVATRVAGDSLAPINAQYYDHPFGPPVVLVAGAHHALLADHAQKNTPVTLISQHRRVAARSYNVAARFVTGATTTPLVILTPRTGWWESTAERAGGLVAWLAGVSAAAKLKGQNLLGRDVHAFATCGHELGHLGLTTLMTDEAWLARAAHCWLHLGANLGCASNLTLFLRAGDPLAAAHMRGLLVEEGYPDEFIRIEPISAVSGEGRDVTEHGGKVLSMAGANTHFHAASDRWPGNVNAAGIASIARAVARWVAQNAGK